MDVFLIGYTPTTATTESADLRGHLATSGHGARAIRDWSALTTDDMRWDIVLDAPDAISLKATVDELGLEISHAMRLVPDRSLSQSVDWAERMMEILPVEPPPTLIDIIGDRGGSSGISATLMPDAETCPVCGWIGGHDPKVKH
jgi:hypothetical protein